MTRGGVVGEIHVANGDRVASGDLLIRLDATITKANLAIVRSSLDSFIARKARLEAERDGFEKFVFPADVRGDGDTAELRRITAGERSLFELRRAARIGQKSQLRERVEQLRKEVEGLDAQSAAKAQEIVLVRKELAGARQLWDKKLYPITRLTQLQREATRLDGERGQLLATVAQGRGKIAETELQIVQLDRELASEVATELREAETKIAELLERKIAAEDLLGRIEMRAPVDGIVHESTVFTVGGVIPANGTPLMLIVPDADELIVDCKIAPHDIDRIRVGQDAVLRFTAFDAHTTPEVNGTVRTISADATTDQHSGTPYYGVRVAFSAEDVERFGGKRLVPGMPVEVFVRTAERSMLTYLVKPLSDQMERAFRER